MKADKAEFVRMSVEALTLDPMTKAPIIVLRDERQELSLPIWIGLLEATSVAAQLEGVALARPMTHDLLKNMIDQAGGSVKRIEVTHIEGNTFFALIHVDFGDEVRAIDSRPSDAISLALRTDSPIYVAREVLERSSVMNDEEDGEEFSVGRETQDISDVSPDEWSDILDKLDPSDFKYKM